MKSLEKHEIRRRLQTLVYTKRIPLAQLERESGLSTDNIKRAMDGSISERDQIRFSRYFSAKDAGKIARFTQENKNVQPHTVKVDDLLHETCWLAARLKERGKYTRFKNYLERLDRRNLNLIYLQYDSLLKKLLLEEFKKEFPRVRFWFHDYWNARSWVDIIEKIRDG